MAMRDAGHEWTVVDPTSSPPVDLSAYTAVFLGQVPATGLVPGAHIVQTIGSTGIFAVYSEDSMLLPIALKTSVCGDAVYVRKSSKGQLSVNFIGTGVPGSAIDPRSVELLGLRPLKSYVEDWLSLPPATTSTRKQRTPRRCPGPAGEV